MMAFVFEPFYVDCTYVCFNLIKFLYIHAIYFQLHTFTNKKGKLYLKAFELYLLKTTLGNNLKIRLIKLVKKKIQFMLMVSR